jgi:hypothetical protein
LQGAAEWYEAQQDGLGLLLLQQAASVYERITSGEHGTPVPHAESGARRMAIRKFPLWAVFIEHGAEVVIVAFAHERRRPGYWLTRVRSS